MCFSLSYDLDKAPNYKAYLTEVTFQFLVLDLGEVTVQY